METLGKAILLIVLLAIGLGAMAYQSYANWSAILRDDKRRQAERRARRARSSASAAESGSPDAKP